MTEPTTPDAPSAGGPARTVRLATMTAREYEEWVGGGSAVAILPTGAFEQHGPHLPLGTDAILSTAVATAALRLSARPRIGIFTSRLHSAS